MAEPKPTVYLTGTPHYDDVRPRSHGATLHRNLDELDVDELDALYGLLEDVAGAHTDGPLERAIAAARVTVYRRIGFRRRADRAIPRPAVADGVEGRALAQPRCESPVCHLAHDRLGRHVGAPPPVGWSV